MTFIGENQPKLKQLANWFTWYTGKQHPSADFLDCRMQCHVRKNSPAGMVSSKPQGLRNVTLMIPSWSRSTPLMIPVLSGKASHQDSSKKSIVKSTVLVSTFETCWQKKNNCKCPHNYTKKTCAWVCGIKTPIKLTKCPVPFPQWKSKSMNHESTHSWNRLSVAFDGWGIHRQVVHHHGTSQVFYNRWWTLCYTF